MVPNNSWSPPRVPHITYCVKDLCETNHVRCTGRRDGHGQTLVNVRFADDTNGLTGGITRTSRHGSPPGSILYQLRNGN